MTDADPVAACLAEVRERIALVSSPVVEPVPVPGDDAGNARLRLWLEDAPRLVAAVEAVLAVHPPYLLDGLPAHCKHDGFDWPCPTVRVISAALVPPALKGCGW